MRYARPSKRSCGGFRLFLGLTLLLGAANAATSKEAGTPERRGSGYQLESFSVDGGAGDSSSADGRMDLSVTVGQPDAGTQRGGDYELDTGVWEVSAAVAVASLSLLGSVLLLTAMLGPGAFRLRRTSAVAAGAILGLLAFAERASAEALSTEFTVQGRLLLDGAPVNDVVSMTFKLYNSAAGPTSLGTVDLPAVQVTNGGFNATLDFGESAFDGQKRWLGFSIDGAAEMTPRQALTATPHAVYAMNAANTDTLDGLLPSNFALASHQHAASEISSGTLDDGRIPSTIARDSEIMQTVLDGDGTDSGLDADLLDGVSANQFLRSDLTGATLAGSLSITGGTDLLGLYVEGSIQAVRGRTNSTSGIGILGYAAATSGNTFGIYGAADSQTGVGVFGVTSFGSGASFGVLGETISASGAAVKGHAKAASGGATGVHGVADSTSGRGVVGEAGAATGSTIGVRGDSSSTSGTGVWGAATATTGVATGVFGTSASTSGKGVYGKASAATGGTRGVVGESSSTSGIGVLGDATAASGATVGVVGRTESTDGYGVSGSATADSGFTRGVYGQSFSTAGTGVYGVASTLTGTNYGVRGSTQSSDGYGVHGTHNSTTGTTAGVYGSTISTADNAYAVHGEIATTAGSGAAAVRGEISSTGSNGSGVLGTHAGSGNGVMGRTVDGTGVRAVATGTGVALLANGSGGNIIEAYGSTVSNLRFRVWDNGNVTADGTIAGGGADFAELLPAAAGLEPGDLLAIGPDGKLALSSRSYQTSVAGIYSTQPGFLGGSGDDINPSGKVPLAIVGIVPVKAVAENGDIRPGDLLVASSTRGHAMKGGSNPPNGTVVGKALSSLESGKGTIQMLVTLQ